MIEKDLNAQTSILDRLLDHDPKVASEPVRDHLSVRQIKDAVIRDLENLLNTRRQILVPPPEYHEVHSSLYMYGLQDFTMKNPGSPMVKQKLRQVIERTIARFEPRLKNVNVQIEAAGQNARDLRFRITAMLVMDPITEPVIFDTFFDVSRGEYKIQK
jgi:type VI secretion system protein ImpF